MTKTISKAKQVIESFDENQISVLHSYQDVLHEKLEKLPKLGEDILQGTKFDLEKEIEYSGDFKCNIKECIFQIESVVFTQQASEPSTSGVATPNTSVNKLLRLPSVSSLQDVELEEVRRRIRKGDSKESMEIGKGCKTFQRKRWSELKKAKSEGKRAKIVKDKLIIEGQVFYHNK
ncbi:Hypothetical predicted protein [Paramuricea clavata]|uniref:Uncharacterized protein n=1 Tax=Paramuricea clavata TaxID=317549 RepID=A0A6S7JCF8_PARCT|nr:Hypothetical predicted protein [Paramuricea clavata]